MRRLERLLMSALIAALLLAGAGVAQPPEPKPEPPGGLVRPAPISVADIVERIMRFDKNKDGKVTRDELPERMHHLIARGDTNKDGALDRDEIKKLATTLATAPGGFGVRSGFRVGPGPAFSGFRVGFGPGPGAGGFQVGFGPGPGAIEGVVDDLKLTAKKKALALAAVKAHQENVRKLMGRARGQLLRKMKEVLSEEEFKDFEAALDRPRGATTFINLGPVDAPRGGVERRTEPPQK